MRNFRLFKYAIIAFNSITSACQNDNSNLPPFCVNILRLTWVCFYFFTQTTHMYIHRAEISRVLISPDKVKQTFPAVNFSGVFTINSIRSNSFAVSLISRPWINNRLLSQSRRTSPSSITFGFFSISLREVRRMIALIRALPPEC